MKLFISLTLSVSMFGCITAKNYDKQIRLLVSEGVFAVGSEKAAFMITPEHQQLIKFDKRNYVGVWKIIYCPLVSASDSTQEGYVELYNVTDKQPIEKSQMNISGTMPMLLESENLIEFIPAKEITLAIRLVIKDQSTNRYIASRGNAYLFLYRE